MSGIGLCVETEHFCPVKAVELLGLFHEEGMAEDSLGWIVPLLTVETVNASEVGNAAFRGDSCAAEEYYTVRISDYIRQFFDIVHIICLP